MSRTGQWLVGGFLAACLFVAVSLANEGRAMATACSLMDLVCYCESEAECIGGNIYGCVGVPVREMQCGVGGASCQQFVGCQGFTNDTATLCALSGPEYRCSNHPANGGNLEQFEAACQDCTGCYDNQSGFSACPSQTICWYPNGTGNDAECGTLADLTEFTVVHHDGANVISWTTATERNNLGFNVYKVKETGGILRRVNGTFILGSMKSPAGENYRIRDPEGRPGDIYRLEWIDHDGPVHYRGPVSAVEGKVEPLRKRFDAQAIRAASRDRRRALEATGIVTSALTSGECKGLRLLVNEDGLYRASVADLDAAGLDVSGLAAGDISLTSQGVAVPFRVSGDGALTKDHRIEFYGMESTSQLSAEQVYLLTPSDEDSTPMAQIAAAPVAAGDWAGSYVATRRYEENLEYALTPAIDDFFYWSYIYYDHPEEVFTLPVSNPVVDQGTFSLVVDLDGISDNPDLDPDHHHQVLFNGNLVKDFTWEGVGLFRLEEDLPSAWLKDGDNTVTVKTIDDLGSPYDMVAVDGFTLVYERAFAAEDDQLAFAWSGAEPNVLVEGFTSADVSVFDLSDPGYPVRLTGVDVQPAGDGFSAAFSTAGATADSSFLAITDGAVKAPMGIEARYPTDIKDASNGADLLIVTFDAFASALEPLVQLRRDQGFRVAVVGTSEIFDAFGHGAVSDQAIKDFIAYAATKWEAPAPAGVLLVGDSTNDPKDYLDLGLVNYVPSHPVESSLWGGTTSDNWYADLDDDGTLDTAIGRLSVATVEETQQAVQKIVDYETGDSALAGSRRVILIADKTDPKRNENFDAIVEDLAQAIPAGYDTVALYADDFDTESAARQAVKDELDKGSLLVVYLGHGSGLSWGSTPLFEAKDIQALPDGVHQPLAIALSCVNGYFTYPGLDILGEAFVKPADRGAIASWMPGDIGLSSRHELLIKAFVGNLFSEGGLSTGEAVRRALNTLAASGGTHDRALAMTFVLLGDPSQQLHTIESGLQEPDSSGGCANRGAGTLGLFSAFALFAGLFGVLVIRRRRLAIND